MAKRRAAAAGVVAALTALTAAGVDTAIGAEPAGAQAAGDREVLVGQFLGANDSSEEVIAYRPGPGGDRLVRYAPHELGDPLVVELSQSLTINGDYEPIVGDFIGDGRDEVIWYAPGPAADSMWTFDAQGNPTSSPLTINGTYIPVVGQFQTVRDGIVWYAPGTAQDIQWTFPVQSGPPSSAPLTINGTYQPLAGFFVASDEVSPSEDIFWYAPGAAPDYLWNTANWALDAFVTPKPVNGTYEPFVVNLWGGSDDDIFWYAPGAAADTVWDFDGSAEDHRNVAQVVNGDYDPVAAGDLFDDGNEDVIWAYDGGYRLWDVWETEFPEMLDIWTYTVTSGPAALFP